MFALRYEIVFGCKFVIQGVWIEYNLHTLPAIVFMKRGQEVDRVVGVKFDELERKLHKYAQSFF